MRRPACGSSAIRERPERYRRCRSERHHPGGFGGMPGELIQVAKRLGIARSTLYRRLEEYGLSGVH